MRLKSIRAVVLIALGGILAAPLVADVLPGTVDSTSGVGTFSLTAPVCNPSQCDLIEGNLVVLPFIAFAGDVILLDADGTVSDVVRFFNNIVNTGGGTGLGNEALVYSKVDSGADGSAGPDLGLPPPSTYSVNAIRMFEAPDGLPTIYNGNGTLYSIYSDIPEDSGLALLCLALLGITVLHRRFSRIPRGSLEKR